MPANRQKRKPPKTAYKPGQSGNPAGAPKRGESWAELFKTIGDMTPDEVAQMATQWAAKLRTLPKGVTLKTLVVIRAYTALLDESNARLLKEVMDRVEGKTVENVSLTVPERIVFEVVRTAIPDTPPSPAPEAEPIPEQSGEA